MRMIVDRKKQVYFAKPKNYLPIDLINKTIL